MKRVSNSIGARLNELTFYCQKIKSKWQSSMPNHCTRLETQTFCRDLWKWWSECKKVTWQSLPLIIREYTEMQKKWAWWKRLVSGGVCEIYCPKGQMQNFREWPLVRFEKQLKFCANLSITHKTRGCLKCNLQKVSFSFERLFIKVWVKMTIYKKNHRKY